MSDELRKKLAEWSFQRWLLESYLPDLVEWDNLSEKAKAWFYNDADSILSVIDEVGYVKLAEDQKVPVNPYPNQTIDKEVEAGRVAYYEAQHDLQVASFRKVEHGSS